MSVPGIGERKVTLYGGEMLGIVAEDAR